MKSKNIKTASVTRLNQEIRRVILSARKFIARNIDTVQVLTNYEIGRRIVEHEQKGSRILYSISRTKADFRDSVSEIENAGRWAGNVRALYIELVSLYLFNEYK